MGSGYSFKEYEKDNMSRVLGKDIPVSTKQCIMICNAIRNRKIERAKKILEDCIGLKRPIAFTRFTNGLGHKRGTGMSAGRFPEKTAFEILKLVRSLETNAQQKGLNTSSMVIIRAVANLASRSYHFSRQRGRKMKNSHIELCAAEAKAQPAQPEKEKRAVQNKK